jgi:hypothetical protein
MKRLAGLFFDILKTPLISQYTKFSLLVLLEIYEICHTRCCEFVVHFADEIRTGALL